MEFLYLLENIRFPLLDKLMLLITSLGEETAFLAVAIITYWCLDKNRGYYLMTVGFIGTIFNQFLKLLCRIPRPWVKDPNFTIVEEAREAASGYSFPSGHSQSAVGTFGGLAATVSNKALRTLFIVIAVLVPFSRMYLGVHTPADVLVGSAISLFFLIVLQPIIYHKDGRHLPKLLGVMLVLAGSFVLYMELFPFPGDVDPDNYHSALENSYTLLGALLGMIVVWCADRRLDFPTQGIWYAQVLKTVLGLALALAVKEGLKLPLDALFGGHMIARTVRYFLLVLVAGIAWPLTFPRFAKLGRKDDAA